MPYVSLIKHLEDVDVINDIRLTLNTPQGNRRVFLIVEGDTDLSLYRRILKCDNLEVKLSRDGKCKVIRIIDELSKHSSQVLGFVDADFDNILNNKTYPHNILLTDYHDLEMMMIKCHDIYKNAILSFVIHEELLFTRDNIFDLIEFVSSLKFMNESQNLGLNLNPSFRNSLDLNNNKFKRQGYLNKVYLASNIQNSIISADDIISETNNINDQYNLTNGHDFMIAVTELINYINKKSNHFSGNKERDIARSFSLLYNLEHFKTSLLYHNFTSWLAANNHSEILSHLS